MTIDSIHDGDNNADKPMSLWRIVLTSILSGGVVAIATLLAQLWIQPIIAERQFRKTERFAAKQVVYVETVTHINRLWNSLVWSGSPQYIFGRSGPDVDVNAANECYARLILLADDADIPNEFYRLITADIGQLKVNDRVIYINRLRKDLYGDEMSGLTLDKKVQYFFDKHAILTNNPTK